MKEEALYNEFARAGREEGSDETVEEVGSFRIIQKKRGYRFTVDSVLLSHFVLPIKRCERVIDIGAGSGVIPLLILQNGGVERMTGVEVQEGLFELAERNLALNNLTETVELVRADYRELKRLFMRGSFDLIISNPPYVKEGCGRVSTITERAIARMEQIGSLGELIEISAYLLSREGRVCYIYPVSRLKELLSAIHTEGLTAGRIRFIHPKEAGPAELFLVEANYSRQETVIESPIFLSQWQGGGLQMEGSDVPMRVRRRATDSQSSTRRAPSCG